MNVAPGGRKEIPGGASKANVRFPTAFHGVANRVTTTSVATLVPIVCA